MTEEKKQSAEEVKAKLLELDRERIKEAEQALQELCKDLDIMIVPVVQIVPGQTPSATLMVQLNKG